MITSEIITISIPAEIYDKLFNDATMFEIVGQNEKPNMNNLYCRIIKGFFDTFNKEMLDKQSKIVQHLSSLNSNDDQNEKVAQRIVEEIFLPVSEKKRGIISQSIHLRPTKEIAGIVNSIHDMLWETESTVSGYYRSMFMSYCSLPMYEREKIVFSDNYEIIKKSIKDKVYISFCIRNKPVNEFIPYYLSTNSDGMNNYLIGAVRDTTTYKLSTRSFRLNRISLLNKTGTRYGSIDKTTLDHLEKMKKSSPHHAINLDQEICVKMNETGKKNYKRIYHERPQCIRQEKDLYYFDCSEEQIMTYFKKLGDTVEIISPVSLRNKMKEYYTNAWKGKEDTHESAVILADLYFRINK